METKHLSPIISHRITCAVHHRVSSDLIHWFSALNHLRVYQKNGRNVRQRQTLRYLMPGSRLRLEDSPIDVFQCTLTKEKTPAFLNEIYRLAELSTPGRGTLMVQEVKEYNQNAETEDEPLFPKYPEQPSRIPGTLQKMAVLTTVLSTPGSSEKLADICLNLGVGVPIITLGTGTGIRDRLGLLRITVPANKELVQVLIPEIDAQAIFHQFIEKGKLNRPGQGFLYYTPVSLALPDTRLRIGHQDHAASIEQMIATLDELNSGTHWRRRANPQSQNSLKLIRNNTEIRFICPEGRADAFVERALEAGARGATVAQVSKIRRNNTGETGSAMELTILTVPQNLEQPIIENLLNTQEESGVLENLQTISAPLSYSHGA